jgi:nucleoid-associated protein YgaU
MGLMDFFKKGTEKPAETKKTPPADSPLGSPYAGTNPANREYVVKSGDSLSKIAKQFYGNANDWKKIHEANRDTIKNPDLIHPGQKIIIP